MTTPLSPLDVMQDLVGQLEEPKTVLTVLCTPDLNEPDVTEQQHRVVCLTKPYSTCLTCKNSTFSLLFKSDSTVRFQQVACPRWEDERRRLNGEPPERYVATEEATCEGRPFSFCSSCPSRAVLKEKYSADKTKEGWFGRWKRLRTSEFEDD